MKVLIRKWGNSASVRIPVPVMESAGLHLDQPVNVREQDGRIIIEPIRAAQYELDALVAGITDENRHELAETGPPIGREAW